MPYIRSKLTLYDSKYLSKKPSMASADDGYTGADESATPMTDAETYEVTEFDNNIWGEAT